MDIACTVYEYFGLMKKKIVQFHVVCLFFCVIVSIRRFDSVVAHAIILHVYMKTRNDGRVQYK